MRLSGALMGNQRFPMSKAPPLGKWKQDWCWGFSILPKTLTLLPWRDGFQRIHEQQQTPVSPKGCECNREAAALLHSQTSEWRVTIAWLQIWVPGRHFLPANYPEVKFVYSNYRSPLHVTWECHHVTDTGNIIAT